jgi:hypothetical protein
MIVPDVPDGRQIMKLVIVWEAVTYYFAGSLQDYDCRKLSEAQSKT